MHLHNCRCFQEHLRILLQSLRAHCKAPGGPGSIWNNLEALVRATGVNGRFGSGFRTYLHFAHEEMQFCRFPFRIAHYLAKSSRIWMSGCEFSVICLIGTGLEAYHRREGILQCLNSALNTGTFPFGLTFPIAGRQPHDDSIVGTLVQHSLLLFLAVQS